MLEKYLPSHICDALYKQFNLSAVNEIRMRVECPIVICMGGDKYFLSNKMICQREDMDEFIFKITDNSMYAVNDSIKQGYITLADGIRVGICGEVVTELDHVRTIKNVQAVNIRLPHDIKNCSLEAFDYLVDSNVKNTLILSAPGVGKTTFLRDFVRQICHRRPKLNLLVVDERGEIASVVDGVVEIRLGDYVDIYTNCSKTFAFKYGIRSMSPDVFIFDELDIDKDMPSVCDATNSGVKVVATMHCSSINELKHNASFSSYLSKQVFERYVLLTKDAGLGTLSAILDGKLNCLYCR